MLPRHKRWYSSSLQSLEDKKGKAARHVCCNIIWPRYTSSLIEYVSETLEKTLRNWRLVYYLYVFIVSVFDFCILQCFHISWETISLRIVQNEIHISIHDNKTIIIRWTYINFYFHISNIFFFLYYKKQAFVYGCEMLKRSNHSFR